MSITGTFNGVNIVALPSSPGLRSLQLNMTDAVSIVTSPYTGQTQAQQWPGADMWTGTATLPPLVQADADIWISFLAELRGMANCFQLGDPLKTSPRGLGLAGTPSGAVPTVQVNVSNIIGSPTVIVHGWTPNAAPVLLTGDYVQVGYRLHRVLEDAAPDGNGATILNIWPSLRDDYTSTTANVVVNNPQGLFRLATNKRTWSSDYTKLTSLSFQVQEFR